MNWHDYEIEKRIISATSESAAEYEKRMAELVKRLSL